MPKEFKSFYEFRSYYYPGELEAERLNDLTPEEWGVELARRALAELSKKPTYREIFG